MEILETFLRVFCFRKSCINENGGKLKERKIANKHDDNRLKNPTWQEADLLFIYKHDQRVELGSTKQQLYLSGQSGN